MISNDYMSAIIMTHNTCILTPLPRKEIKINTKNQGVLNILTCRNLNIL